MPYIPPPPFQHDYAGGVLTDHFWTNVSATATGPLSLTQQVSGTSANTLNTTAPDATAIGMISCRTGTTTTGRAGIGTGGFRLGGIAQSVSHRFYMPSLLDGTENGAIYLGFVETYSAAPVDGAFFYWDNTQTFFRARTRSNNTETDTSMAYAPVAATWYIGTVTVNASGTSARFDLLSGDGLSVLASITSTTNIPTGAGRETGMGANIIKSAGTTQRELYLDYTRFAWGNAAV
jgi:hypothetical protein